MITLHTKIYIFFLLLLSYNAVESSFASADANELTQDMQQRDLTELCECLQDYCHLTENEIATLARMAPLLQELQDPAQNIYQNGKKNYTITKLQKDTELKISFSILGCMFLLRNSVIQDPETNQEIKIINFEQTLDKYLSDLLKKEAKTDLLSHTFTCEKHDKEQGFVLLPATLSVEAQQIINYYRQKGTVFSE